jgi:hypothetical protein
MTQVESYRYPEDTPRLVHIANLSRFLDDPLNDESIEYYMKGASGYGSYEYMKEMGFETNA